MTHDNSIAFPKMNMFLFVGLTILTLGVNIGYWFLKRKKVFEQYDRYHVPHNWWVIATVYLVLSFAFLFLGEWLFTPYGFLHIQSIDYILAFYFIGLLYYSIFRLGDMLEEVYFEPINKYLLFFLHVWYLQYKINQLSKESETLEAAS